MLGWWIVIYPETGTIPEHTLASWESGLGGLDWLRPLLDSGHASQLQGNGYPNRYRLAAHAVLPLLQAGASGKGPLSSYHPERVAACQPEQWLIVEAWDQS